MKRTLLIVLGLALAVGVAWAYVQPAHLSQPTTSGSPERTAEDWSDVPSVTAPEPVQTSTVETQHHGRRRPKPTNPVPEPGTMVLASMGLIALGAAARRPRH